MSEVVPVLSGFRPLRYFLFFKESKRVRSQGKRNTCMRLRLIQALMGSLAWGRVRGHPYFRNQGRRLPAPSDPTGGKGGFSLVAQRPQRRVHSRSKWDFRSRPPGTAQGGAGRLPGTALPTLTCIVRKVSGKLRSTVWCSRVT